MADEIENQNVVRITCDGGKWCALIGPDPARGLMGWGTSAATALHHLAYLMLARGWICESTWPLSKGVNP